MDNTELLVRIDANVISLTNNFEEFKKDTKEQQKKQDAKLSAHDMAFGEIDVRMTRQDGKITSGKFWKTFLVVAISMVTLFGALGIWIRG